MSNNQVVVVFVHGWSVTNTDTYGGLPQRLGAEAAAFGLQVHIENIRLGKYISFHDEVKVTDIARAFDHAVSEQLAPLLKDGRRFVCITHSTGGPVIRKWWHNYYLEKKSGGTCPMSHLIMLAPANYGSALAQLGKGRLSRLKFWFGGVEPGQGVLDWLELGSEQAWELNTAWINSDTSQIATRGVFPFVLTGQSIDRAFYDNLNSYTGELGSDGVVRVAAANLRARYIRLFQEKPVVDTSKKRVLRADKLITDGFVEAPTTALRVMAAKSHSGGDMGIMRSVHIGGNDPGSKDTITAIFNCIQVKTKTQYAKLCTRFAEETKIVQADEWVEREDKILKDRYFIHDRYCMVIFRVRDDRGLPVKDYDLVLTAGDSADPNRLPEGFCKDRQRNKLNRETITYFLNYNVMKGCKKVVYKSNGKVVRKALPGIRKLGLKIVPRPQSGFVHYLPCEIQACAELLEKALVPNGTTLIDIRLRRVVHANVFDTEPVKKTGSTSFKNVKPSDQLVP